MEQIIIIAIGFLEEPVTAIIVLYKTFYGDTDFFKIVTGVLQGDTLAPYMFITCLDYIIRKSIDLIKENGIM